MTQKEIILAVANQIQNMMYNDITCENGVECFEAWCADGEVFENDDMTKAEAEECMQLVRKVAPIVDRLVLSNLNIDNPECNENAPEKVWVMTQESNVDGDISFNVVVCDSKESALKAMEEEKDWIKNDSHHFHDYDENDESLEIEQSEHRFFIMDECDDYYEELMIAEKEVQTL